MIYTRNMTQQATYYPPAGQNGFGDVSYGAGVPLAVRWQDKADLFRDAQGREVVSSAIVYCSQDVAVGGKIGLGSATVGESKEIRNVGRSPDLTGQVTLVKVWL
jgi:hypothetical protein